MKALKDACLRKRIAIAATLAVWPTVFVVDLIAFGHRTGRYGYRRHWDPEHAYTVALLWCLVVIPLIWIFWRLLEYVFSPADRTTDRSTEN